MLNIIIFFPFNQRGLFSVSNQCNAKSYSQCIVLQWYLKALTSITFLYFKHYNRFQRQYVFQFKDIKTMKWLHEHTILMSFFTEYLLRKACPDVRGSSPVIILNVVVFPAPFWPSKPKHSFFGIPTETVFTAWKPLP